MAKELQMVPKCPSCGRLTVDNKQHCPEKSTAKWAEVCQWMVCVKCRYTYGTLEFKGFPRSTNIGGTP